MLTIQLRTHKKIDQDTLIKHNNSFNNHRSRVHVCVRVHMRSYMSTYIPVYCVV